jgi:voltage-gated potassium channel
VIACVDSDAENIFVALSARELSSDVTVIARASADDAERKLIRAGANEVISPYKISGSEMARLALSPPART